MLRTTRDDVKHIKHHFGEQLEMQTQQLDQIKQQIHALSQGTKPPQRKRIPLRDPADNTVFHWLMQLPKPPKQRRISFLRFRMAITLLNYTGMRAVEVAEVTDTQIDTAIQYGHLDITLAKTHKPHRYVLTKAARDSLRELSFERIHVFAMHKRLAGLLRKNHWVEFINLNLLPAVKHFGLNLKSHSFRVGYVTHLLKYAPVQHTASIVGHVDIRSTIAYNRYVPDREYVIQLLERSEQGRSPQRTLSGPLAHA